MGPTDRVVVLIDMDCFYCQVEEKLDSKLAGKPIAVVQYNAWRGGGIIAVNYPARDQGVTRHMRGNDAKKACPSINLVRVPEVRGKADLTKYRDAGKEVADVLATFTPLLQRASVDEAYLDITDAVQSKIDKSLDDLKIEDLKNTFVVGSETEDFVHNVLSNGDILESDLKLAVGGLICEQIRAQVFEKTGYKCSAGIAHNKTLAKLVCSLHKPNKQTILPQGAVEEFFKTVPVKKVTSLGGKFGESLTRDLGIKCMGELTKFSLRELQDRYDEKNGTWLYNIARGIDLEPVTTKLISKSIACCKNFPGSSALLTSERIQHWLGELSSELAERLEKDLKENNRKAKQLIVSFSQTINGDDVHSSRTTRLPSYESHRIAHSGFEVIKKHCLKPDGGFIVKFLGLSAGGFEDNKNIREITSFFVVKPNNTAKENEDDKDIFSEDTLELNEDVDKMVFYDNSSVVNTVEQSSPSCSFFKRYFNSVKKESQEVVEDSQNVDVELENPSEECPECKKLILRSEMVSHQDYHFALNLVKEERNSNRATPKVKEKENLQKTKKGVKRKSNETTASSVSLLTNFLKKDVVRDDEESEICSECKKRIPLRDFPNHVDYHVAKKIHLEINSVKTNTLFKPLL